MGQYRKMILILLSIKAWQSTTLPADGRAERTKGCLRAISLQEQSGSTTYLPPLIIPCSLSSSISLDSKAWMICSNIVRLLPVWQQTWVRFNFLTICHNKQNRTIRLKLLPMTTSNACELTAWLIQSTHLQISNQHCPFQSRCKWKQTQPPSASTTTMTSSFC